jgi:hypothetical protein
MGNMEEIYIEEKRNKDEDILYPMMDPQQRSIIPYTHKIMGLDYHLFLTNFVCNIFK